jgi:hypothetical protein
MVDTLGIDQQPEPKPSLTSFPKRNDHFAAEFRPAVRRPRFFDVGTDGSTRTQQLLTEGTVYTGRFAQVSTQPNDSNCEPIRPIFDFQRLILITRQSYTHKSFVRLLFFVFRFTFCV